jgi:hypothetical protein
MEPLTINRDTGRFDSRQWFIEGHEHNDDCWFSMEKDAQAAVRLAGHIEIAAKREMGNEIRAALDRAEP